MGLLFETPRARLRRRWRRSAPSPLVGRTVLVTGASSGIGEGTALAAADRGATVLLVARRSEELERVRAEVLSRGGHAASYVCDLTDGDAVDALVAEVLAEHGVVDYLVNNAGRSIRRSLHLSYGRMHDFERTMAVNYFGLVRTAMVVPTESYEDRRALSAEQAAARVVRALEERPVSVDLLAGRVGEVLNIARRGSATR